MWIEQAEFITLCFPSGKQVVFITVCFAFMMNAYM